MLFYNHCCTRTNITKLELTVFLLHQHDARHIYALKVLRGMEVRFGSVWIGSDRFSLIRFTHPDVDLRAVIFLALEQLRGSIGRAATPRLEQGARLKVVTEAKVCNTREDMTTTAINATLATDDHRPPMSPSHIFNTD